MTRCRRSWATSRCPSGAFGCRPKPFPGSELAIVICGWCLRDQPGRSHPQPLPPPTRPVFRPAAPALCPPLLLRLRLSTVCRRWQAVVLSPPLLAQVAIEAGTGNDIDMLRVATSWLMRRAAGSVQQLSVDLQHAEFDPDCEEREEAVVLITATLAALGARGTLRQVSMQLGSFTMLPLGAWAAALSGLQQLSIAGKEGRISVSGDLRGLTALQSLELEDEDVQLAASTQLPPSLTHFKLSSSSYVGDSSGLAPQVRRLTLIAGLRTGMLAACSGRSLMLSAAAPPLTTAERL